jgi:hypothetical protein
MDIPLGARDIEVAADHDAGAAGMNFGDVLLQLPEKFHFGWKILAAVRYVNRSEDEAVGFRGYDPGFKIEGRMGKPRLVGKRVAADMEPDAGVGFGAVPVASVALQFTNRTGNLSRRGFELLKAHDIGLLALNPFENLRLPRADSIHVPGGDFQERHDRKTYTMFARARSLRPDSGARPALFFTMKITKGTKESRYFSREERQGRQVSEVYFSFRLREKRWVRDLRVLGGEIDLNSKLHRAAPAWLARFRAAEAPRDRRFGAHVQVRCRDESLRSELLVQVPPR